jgi:competence protein ComEC
VACVVVAAAAVTVTVLRAEADRTSPVGRLATTGAVVTVTARVTSDPLLRAGPHGRYSLTRVTVLSVRTGAGPGQRTHVPALVVGDEQWRGVRLGETVTTSGRLGPSSGPDLAGVLSARRTPQVVRPSPRVFEAAEAVRAGIRRAVRAAPPDARALVPALVVGDDQQLPGEVVDDFRTCGLTHLAAVSGTNLTLVAGFLLLVARWVGVRARGLVVVGVLGVVGFVVLARPEPSVLRAAAMGSVALLGMGSRGSDRGLRALGVALVALLLLDPWLAASAGFVLSTLATAGILVLGPPFRDALTRWLPRWAAEALAVPFAAQLACTPVVAALSGQVSLVAVLANLLAAPAVGPATVLGLLGGLLVLVCGPLGLAAGWAAGMCAAWIVAVAVRLAELPQPSIGWHAGGLSVALLAVVCVLTAVVAGRLLRRAVWSATLGVVLVVVLLRPLPTPGWPPAGWVLVACDVGQGDGLVLRAGKATGVVVDTGPDPRAMDRCLDRLGIDRVPVLVLTHFHADHVDGLPGVLGGRSVGEVDVTATQDPAYGADEVAHEVREAHVPERVPVLGEVRRAGAVSWRVVGPVTTPSAVGHGEEGSLANNASLVLLVRVQGIDILMSGDMEPEAQRALAAAVPDLHADVLKVPHHGSRYQDPALLAGLGARLAVISVGADNDYGHPAAATVAMLRAAGMRVERTDLDGDVAVTVRAGRLGVTSR